FSALGGSNATPCTSRSGAVCVFSTPITTSGPINATSTFTFTDSAGNNATIQHGLFVYGIRNETSPNYWTNSVTCSPSLVDRSVTRLINVRLYCHIALKTSTPDASTATIAFDPRTCTGDIGAISDLGLSNNYVGSTEPVLYTLLQARDFNMTSLDYTCPLRITTRVGDFISINHEVENASVHIGFYSRPQADLSKSVLAKFDKAKKDALKLDTLIGSLKKLFEVFEKICTIRAAIVDALAAMDSVMASVDYVKSGLELQKAGTELELNACAPYCPTLNLLVNAQNEIIRAAGLQKFFAGLKVPDPPGIIGKLQVMRQQFASLDPRAKALDTSVQTTQQNAVVAQKAAMFQCVATLAVIQASPAGLTGLDKECVAAIAKMNRLIDASAKLEESRQKICGFKEGKLQEAFTKSIDKFAKRFCSFVYCDSGPLDSANGLFEKTFSVLGGGLLDVNGFLTKSTGLNPGINKKESLVWSVASLCLPGIINNIDKYRQVNCNYALCIGKDVVERGLPISQCEKKREAQMCAFVWGEVFNAVPFVHTLDGWVNTVKELVTNPLAAMAFLLGQYCKSFCGKDLSKISSTQYKICAFPKTLDALAKVIKDVQGIIQPSFWQFGHGACDDLKALKPTPKKAGTGAETGGAGVRPQ
ncbi:MAG: hypothetical protein AABY13_01125, partial [Nanoarchaeota archaeon]